MIKLTVIIRDKNYLQQLTDFLLVDKNINVSSTFIINNLKNEMQQAVAFMKQMIEQRPDILLVDQNILRDAAAIDLRQTLDYLDKLPTTKIIVVGKRFNEENVMVMMQVGVRGFFRIALGGKQLIKCIRAVSGGDIWLENKLTSRVLDEVIKEFKKQRDLLKSLTHMGSAKLEMLSPREMEILALISQSMTNEEIADKLFLSSTTVKTHLRNIFAKADIRNRVEAALLYTRHTLKSH
jgi:DNA-binding NarL/FixJ family response regulator